MSTTYHDNEIKIIEHVMRALRRQINPSNATGKKIDSHPSLHSFRTHT